MLVISIISIILALIASYFAINANIKLKKIEKSILEKIDKIKDATNNTVISFDNGFEYDVKSSSWLVNGNLVVSGHVVCGEKKS